MNTATENLEDDHVHILRLIDVMEHITNWMILISDHLERIVEIIKNFADGIHHAKEETISSHACQKGFSLTQGPVAVMLNDMLQGEIL